MKINILTLYPQIIEGFINTGVIAKAVDKGIITFNIIDFRNYSTNKHHKVDDYPYSGGGGMLLSVEPLDLAITLNNLEDTHTIFPSPIGPVFNQQKAIELSKYDELTFVAGRFEGVDERFIKLHVDEQISMGDFILTGGELAIATIVDATLRYVEGVLGNSSSASNDSFSNGLLEHPQYTRPQIYKELSVPEVLINGNHKLIEAHNLNEQLTRTYLYRPDLLEKIELSEKESELLEKIKDKLQSK